MRARIRTIKPDFFSNPKLNAISVGSRYVAIGLMSMADDRGRIHLMLPAVRGYIFPNGDITEKQFEMALRDVESTGFAWRYLVEPFTYLWLPGFWRHQKINRPSESSLPPHPSDPYAHLGVVDALAQYKDDREDGNDLLSDESLNAHGMSDDPITDRSSPPARTRADAGASLSYSQSLSDVSTTTRSRGVRELFVYWQATCGHPNAVLDAKRRSAIEGRLRDGHAPEQIKLAIDGAARDAYVDVKGKRFDDIELICRNSSKLESFIARGVGTNVTPIQAAPSTEPDKYERAMLARTEALLGKAAS